MEIEVYIASQALERQNILTNIHRIILANDPTIEAAIEPMMAKQMILYKANGFMKYGLASVKNYMSLHVMPIYGNKNLYEKYRVLLPEPRFQKGCINFVDETQMPLAIIQELIQDCSGIDLAKMKEDYLMSRKINK